MSVSNATVNNADSVDKTAFHISGESLLTYLLTYLLGLLIVTQCWTSSVFVSYVVTGLVFGLIISSTVLTKWHSASEWLTKLMVDKDLREMSILKSILMYDYVFLVLINERSNVK